MFGAVDGSQLDFEFVNFRSIESKSKYEGDNFLLGKFDDDVKDLFGIRGSHLKQLWPEDAEYITFSRLIDGFLNYHNKEDNDEIRLNWISLLGEKLIRIMRSWLEEGF